MTTALDLIKRSMRLMGSLGSGEVPTAAEAQDCLVAMNSMLDAWRLERLLVYRIAEDIKTLTAGDGTYTIGAGGDINTTRPERLAIGSYVRFSGADSPIEVIDSSVYSAVAYKAQQGIPAAVYYIRAVPLGTLYLWPVPDQAYELHLMSYHQLQSFSSLTTDLVLPAGYEDLIAFSLPERVAPEFGVPVPVDVARQAAAAKNRLKHGNAPRLLMRTSGDLADAGLYGGAGYDIRTSF